MGFLPIYRFKETSRLFDEGPIPLCVRTSSVPLHVLTSVGPLSLVIGHSKGVTGALLYIYLSNN